MTEGLAAVQSRVAQIQTLLGIRPSTSAAAGSVAATNTAFASALQDATGNGLDTDLTGLNAGNATTTGTLAGTTNGTATGAAAVQIATQYLGVPYQWGGTDPSSGLDCSGLVQLVYGQLGVDLPRTSSAQAQQGTPVASLSDAKPGDLVFFGNPVHHVGIYVGNGKMLNAPHSGAKVRIENVWGTPSAIRRVLPSTAAAGLSGLGLDSSGAISLASVSTAGSAATGSASSLSGTPYANLFTAAGQKYGLDPSLLSAVAKAESGYQTNAVSSAGARGMMQLMPGTARGLGVDPDVATQAVDGAARLLSGHLRAFNGRVDLALAAYNAGAGAVRKYDGIPPYTETQNYVRKVTGYWGELR